MTPPLADHYHTAPDEWLAAYSAGSLSVAKSLLVSCQASVKPELANKLAKFDEVGGAFLETAKAEPLSTNFADLLDAAIDGAGTDDQSSSDAPAPAQRHDEWAPAPLENFLSSTSRCLRWRRAAPGISIAALETTDQERLYLLKAKAGMKMPVHSHRGEEWTLVLQGGYHIGETGYQRGDLHVEGRDCTHQPIIDDHGEDCITLVADAGPIKPTNPLIRLLQPFIGI